MCRLSQIVAGGREKATLRIARRFSFARALRQCFGRTLDVIAQPTPRGLQSASHLVEIHRQFAKFTAPRFRQLH